MTLVGYAAWFFYGLTTLGLLMVKYRTMGSIFRKDPKVQGVQVHGVFPVFLLILTLFTLIFPFTAPESVVASGLALGVIVFSVIPYWLMKRKYGF